MLVDSRTALASLRFSHAGRQLELTIDRGHVRLYAIEPSRRSLPAFEPRVATGGEALFGWLAEHVEALRTSPDALETVAAVGALVRFFTPAQVDDAGTGAPHVVRGARAWARSIDEECWAELEGAARERAARLAKALDEEALDGLALALERDVLESVAVAMRLAGRGARIGEALHPIDREARARLSALTEDAPSADDPRLRAVSWGEPEAWWGTLAR
jgi:hypothetical protein